MIKKINNRAWYLFFRVLLLKTSHELLWKKCSDKKIKKIKKNKKNACIILIFIIECRSTADFETYLKQVNGLVAQVVRAHAW